MLFATIASTIFGSSKASTKHRWKVTQHIHESYPLFLRYPIDLDYDKLQKSFPILFIITIPFSEITDNGLPESTFNKAVLEPLDAFIFDALRNIQDGHCVLVETFNTNRHYYFYVSLEFDAQEFVEKLSPNYPYHPIKYESSDDSAWAFIRWYADKFQWQLTHHSSGTPHGAP